MNLFTFSSLVGNTALNYFVPNAQNMMFLHLMHQRWLTGSSLQNMAPNGGTSGTVVGAPTFPAGGGMITNTAGNDGLATGYTDPGGDLTLIVVAQYNDLGTTNLNSGQFLTAYGVDPGGVIAGNKGVNITTSPASSNIVAISAIARSANVITVTTSAAHGFLTSQFVTIAGVTGDTTMNGFVIVTVTGTTTFTYASAGANGSGVVTGATAQNGNEKLVGADTWVTGTGTQSITSISRSGSTVTLVAAAAITGLVASGPVYVVGVTGDASYNGVWTALTVSGSTVTYTSAGTAGSGTVTGSTASLAVNTHSLTLFSVQTTLNTPHYIALTIQASTGTRTLYDMTAGTTIAATNPGPRLLQATSPPVFMSGVSPLNFGGKSQIWWTEGHSAVLSAAQLAANYATTKAYCASLATPIVI